MRKCEKVAHLLLGRPSAPRDTVLSMDSPPSAAFSAYVEACICSRDVLSCA